jgi:nucleoside-diphosphate-sugar epimerase
MRVFVTGGTGVLGRAVLSLLAAAGHRVGAPRSGDLDLYDPAAVRWAVAGDDAVLHLATRIPRPDRAAEPGAWDENDRRAGGGALHHRRAARRRAVARAALRAGDRLVRAGPGVLRHPATGWRPQH